MQATLSSKSQITLPKGLQAWLGLHQGDKINFVLDEGGARLTKVSPASFASLQGILPPPTAAHSVDEMNHAIVQAVAARHTRAPTPAANPS
jgi:antitoxin PrlF